MESLAAADYGSKDFWEERYSSGPEHFRTIFDWFPADCDRDPVVASLEAAGVPKHGRVLDVGCGNSVLSRQIWEEGYARVVGIDFSEAVVEAMAAGKPQGADGLHYMHMDASTMSFSDGTMSAVVDKGLLDAVLATNDRYQMWQSKGMRGGVGANNAQDGGEEAATRSLEKGSEVLREIHRVLCKGGLYVCVSYEGPRLREPLLRANDLQWDVQRRVFSEDKDQHMYLCCKR